MVERIKELCSQQGKTIKSLEIECGIGNGIIARWNKSSPSYKRLSAVAQALGVTVEYLQTGEIEKDPAPIKESEVIPKYSELSEENRALVNSMIEKLLKSQSI